MVVPNYFCVPFAVENLVTDPTINDMFVLMVGLWKNILARYATEVTPVEQACSNTCWVILVDELSTPAFVANRTQPDPTFWDINEHILIQFKSRFFEGSILLRSITVVSVCFFLWVQFLVRKCFDLLVSGQKTKRKENVKFSKWDQT